jgi:hypothetical protein
MGREQTLQRGEAYYSPRLNLVEINHEGEPDAEVARAAKRVISAHERCAAIMTTEPLGRPNSATPDDMAAYSALSAARLASLEALKRIAAEGLEGLDAKREVLRALLSWLGPDEDVCLFAAHLAEEAIAVSKHYHALLGKMNNAGTGGTVGGPGRWLAGVAGSFPGFLFGRRDSGSLAEDNARRSQTPGAI